MRRADFAHRPDNLDCSTPYASVLERTGIASVSELERSRSIRRGLLPYAGVRAEPFKRIGACNLLNDWTPYDLDSTMLRFSDAVWRVRGG